MITGIYCIINRKNNKKYIGQSIDIEDRKKNHFTRLKNNKHYNIHLQNAYNYYENFDFYIIAKCNKNELDFLEKMFIRLYKTTNSKYGYNLESGGHKNKTLSDETKKKISLNHANVKGKKNPNYGKDFTGDNNPFYGRTHSLDSKKKMREAKLGKKLSQNHKDKISKSLKGRQRSLKECESLSKGNNNTGYFRVSKKIAKSTKQGFNYTYSWTEDGKHYAISSISLKKLEKKVRDKNLPWKKFDLND